MSLPEPYYKEDGITIYCADCHDILPYLEPVDLVLTDPPYGVNHAQWDCQYLTGWERDALSLARKGMVFNTGEKAICTAINALGKDYKGLFYAWNRNGMTRSPLGYMNVIVAVVAGKVERGQNFAQFTIKDLSRKDHPSPKPIEYIQCLVARFSVEGDTILDPFMGSGTTLVAAKQLGRKAIGIEIEEKYCKIAVERLKQGVLNFEEGE